MPEPRETEGSRNGLKETIGAYLVLTKARIVVMILITTAAGFYIASPGGFDALTLLSTLFGTALVAGGTNALNQYMERHLDSLMKRTRRRPLPGSRMTERAALRFSVAISVIGVVWLWFVVNPLASILTFATLASYLFIYTPLKQKTDLCTVIGAVPGAIPPMIGWAGAVGHLDLGAWILFGLMFLWQLPHFLAIAWLYREDYGRAGFAIISVNDRDGTLSSRQAFVFSLALLPVSLLPTLARVAGLDYLVGAAIVGAMLLLASLSFLRTRSIRSARMLFGVSNLYLVVVMSMLVISAGIH
ncbi:MAG: heme o synthase [Thermoanaerobaculia bacterium]